MMEDSPEMSVRALNWKLVGHLLVIKAVKGILKYQHMSG